MTVNVKATVILLATLALGMALGSFATGALAQRRQQRIEAARREGGFVALMEEVIRPRDEAQRAEIRPLLEATDQRNREIVDGANDSLRVAMESLREDLADYLDEDQMARLAEVGRLPPPPIGGPAPAGRQGGRAGAPPPGAPPPGGGGRGGAPPGGR